jgi:hypothetical protein
MEKKKERILLQSLKRQQQVEDLRRLKEVEKQEKQDQEAMKQEEKFRKKEEEKARRQAILESYRLKKAEDMDKDVSLLRTRFFKFNFMSCAYRTPPFVSTTHFKSHFTE